MDRPPVDNPIRFGEGSVTAKRSPFQQRVVSEELARVGFSGEVNNNTTSLEKLARRAAAQKIQQERTSNQLKKKSALLEIDELTEVLNRKGIMSRVNEAVAHHNRSGADYGVLFMDIDGFKNYNDTNGHPEGDKVLKEFAKIFRQDEAFGRYGGDEFVLLYELKENNTAEEIMNRLGTFFKDKGKSDPRWANLAVSVGLRKIQDSNHVDSHTVLRDADGAMYEAKKTPGTHLVEWQQGMEPPPEASFGSK